MEETLLRVLEWLFQCGVCLAAASLLLCLLAPLLTFALKAMLFVVGIPCLVFQFFRGLFAAPDA